MTAEQWHPLGIPFGVAAGSSYFPGANFPGANHNDVSVVVIDQSENDVTVLTRMLDGLGIGRVYGFTDPHEALAHCADTLPDLVLLDIDMPQADGVTMLQSLRRLVAAEGFMPVVALTDAISTEAKERALFAGAKDFLAKPFERTEVLVRVSSLLETRAQYRLLERNNAALRATLDDRLTAERQVIVDRARSHHRIDRALQPGSLAMVFQPVQDLSTGRIVGVEALSRFYCEPQRSPDQWFDEAERLGRGVELELAAVEAALSRFGELPSHYFLAINASPTTAATAELAEMLAQVESDRVVLELTEHTKVDDYEGLIAALDNLREMGVRIAVDDAGAGYSGLQHLLQIRPDVLKLDTTLTREIDRDRVRQALTAALVRFAHETGATIIAEGIESADELHSLQELGIPWGQGFHLGRPAELPRRPTRLVALTRMTPEYAGEPTLMGV